MTKTNELPNKQGLDAPLVMHSTSKIEPYYFSVTDYSECLEECKVKNNGTMIGSVKCQECKNCVEHENPRIYMGDVFWIKCKVIDNARGL